MTSGRKNMQLTLSKSAAVESGKKRRCRRCRRRRRRRGTRTSVLVVGRVYDAAWYLFGNKVCAQPGEPDLLPCTIQGCLTVSGLFVENLRKEQERTGECVQRCHNSALFFCVCGREDRIMSRVCLDAGGQKK